MNVNANNMVQMKHTLLITPIAFIYLQQPTLNNQLPAELPPSSYAHPY